jgi:hypothetical protein
MQSNLFKGLRAWSFQVLLALPLTLAAQQTAVPLQTETPPTLPTVHDLKVIALAGDGDRNDLERRIMAPLVVEVSDQNDRPIEGASVVFRFPAQGPGASFSDQRKSATVRTNAQGQAAAVGWNANNEAGTFEIHVTAAYGNQMGETTISMTNVRRITAEMTDRPRSFWSSKWVKLGVIGRAALATGVIVATRGSGSGSGSSSITITPGSPSVGGPR